MPVRWWSGQQQRSFVHKIYTSPNIWMQKTVVGSYYSNRSAPQTSPTLPSLPSKMDLFFTHIQILLIFRPVAITFWLFSIYSFSLLLISGHFIICKWYCNCVSSLNFNPILAYSDRGPVGSMDSLQLLKACLWKSSNRILSPFGNVWLIRSFQFV